MRNLLLRKILYPNYVLFISKKIKSKYLLLYLLRIELFFRQVKLKINIKNDNFILIEKLKNNNHYWSIPKNLRSRIWLFIKGIKNITNIVMSQESIDKLVDKEIVSSKRWILETDGTNLLDIFTFRKSINIQSSC